MTGFLDRRQFLKFAGGVSALVLPGCAAGPGAPSGAADAPRQAEALACAPAGAGAAGPWWKRTLVLVEFNGGNDGLNTVVPYRDPAYYRLRPTLALAQDKVLPLSESLALHGALQPLLPAWKDCQCAIVLGVGYPEPNLSHFRSIDIWESASDSRDYVADGWVARLMARHRPPRELAAEGIVLGRNEPGPLMGDGMRTVSFERPDLLQGQKDARSGKASTGGHAMNHLLEVRDRLRHAATAIVDKRIDKIDPGANFPKDPFGRQMETASRLILAGLDIPIIKTSIGSFDTHQYQAGDHQRLLGSFAEGVAALGAAMRAKGRWGNVLVMTYGEFGRRPNENGSRGTDHGTAAPHFAIGGGVRGGFYGTQPSLDALADGNLAHNIHFRSLYATVADRWWGLPGRPFAGEPLGFIA